MASVNKVIFVGNVGRDPELRFTPNGNPVCDFTLAVNHYYQKDGERKEEVTWLKVIVWNKAAEASNQYLTKGKRVYVEGRLRIRKFDLRDGGQGTSVEVVAEKVVFLDKMEARFAQEIEDIPPDQAPDLESKAGVAPASESPAPETEDLPF